MQKDKPTDKICYKKAFTLAEILITLGIIGIVAAMTLPTLLAKINERQTISKLRQSQSILTQAIRLSEEQYGGAVGWTNSEISGKGATDIAEKLKTSLKILEDCGVKDTQMKCFADDYKYKNGKATNIHHSTSGYHYKIKLLNGSGIMWRATSEGEKNQDVSIYFFIDTNGPKPPNTLGMDFFLFEYRGDNLLPLGAPDSIYPYTTNCVPKTSDGWGCAYYVLKFGNMDYLH